MRSTPTVRGSIYQWFKKYIGNNYLVDKGAVRIQQIIVSNDNLDTFTKLLSKSTGEYKPIKLEEVSYDWEVKLAEYYNQHADERLDYSLCIYEPCYLSVTRSVPELNFEKHLEKKAGQIEWWFKNGASKRDFFGIKYEENGMPQTFHPDYLIQFKSGKVFIGDTKAGSTARGAKLKAEALQRYIANQNANGKNLVGGIIIEDATKKWRLNQNSEYVYDKNDLTNWAFFDDVVNKQ